ncbi:hypothetical protein [Nonlabens ponticola]|uniref:Uncharacterized protein n=1 Tax=Nonlabens ponticola TaxID=2496866 RepID=A0A3S9MV81_9FLAO|nr:hypothetical protein [Nonlabens ponticola]AZQ43078.1 hypothetical protein EJ995_02075 [Nonlabens ponticola]
MKKILPLLVFLLLLSCQKELAATSENINAVFDTQDFSIRYVILENEEHRMSFMNNVMAYFGPEETIRKELSYDEAILINTFVQDRFQNRNQTAAKTDQLIIYNDTKKVVFETAAFEKEFETLLQQLDIPYVSAKKK